MLYITLHVRICCWRVFSVMQVKAMWKYPEHRKHWLVKNQYLKREKKKKVYFQEESPRLAGFLLFLCQSQVQYSSFNTDIWLDVLKPSVSFPSCKASQIIKKADSHEA